MKKYYKQGFLFVLLVIGLTTFQGCVKNHIDLNKSGNNSISPQYAGALVYSSLTLADIMNKTNKNGQLTSDSTGFVTLVYKGNLFSLKAADVVTILVQPAANANVSLTAAEVLALNTPPYGGNITFSDSTFITFQAGGQTQIDILNCKTANLALSLNYSIKDNAIIKITIPGATLGGVAFTQTIPVTYSGSPVVINQNYSLNGYKIDMTNGNTTHNVIKIKYDVIVAKASTYVSALGDGVSFTQTFNNVTYSSIIGYLGQQSLSPNAADTVPITIFQNSTTIGGPNVSFQIVNPSIKVFLTNSYGLPITASFNTFEGYTPTPSLNTYTITGSGVPNPLPINTPTTIGQSAVGSFTLNNSNSNIVSLINNFPKNVIYNVNSQSNPLGPVFSNFITDTSQFSVDMEIDLPLFGRVKDFEFQDTVNYTFDMPTDMIKSITVRAYIDNGFPIDVGMRLAFVDSAYNVIDELVNPVYQVIMPSANIDANGKVTTPSINTRDFVIPNSVIPQLSKVKHILIGAVANSFNNASGTNVKIYNFYHLDVKIGVNVEMYLKF